MEKFTPLYPYQSNRTSSSKLLDYIKDERFYSTISTITLQLAKQVGAQRTVLQQLSRCFQKIRGSPQGSLLSQQSINITNESIQKKQFSSYYESLQKEIPLKQQINFLSKMENQLIIAKEKQNYSNALNIYASEKQSQFLPKLTIESESKKDRFKTLLRKKNKSKVCTTQNYFKINSLDLLKNAFYTENDCYKMLRSFTLLKTVFGHSMDQDLQSNCPLYNVLFDQTGSLIISGGQQGLIKVWSRDTGLLLSSLKGHQEYINKLQISKCNKYICSAAGDGIRFFLLKQMTTLGGWKTQSIIDIAAVYDKNKLTNKFLFGDKKNLYILDEDVMLAHKEQALSKDNFKIYKYSYRLNKQSFLLFIQVSDDQSKVLLGFQTGDIILFHYYDLFTIDPLKFQTQPLSKTYNLPIRHILKVHRDQMRELKWHPNNQYFVSGGKQGYCLLWEYKNQQTPIVIKEFQVSKLLNRRKKRAFGCNFINFNCSQTHFVAGFMQLVDEDDDDKGNGDLMVYSLLQKQIIFEFSKDMPIKLASVRGMDTHPIYPNIVLICQGTGRILILDFLLKTILNTFELKGFHLGHPQFSLNPGDCRFSNDGRYFVVSTQFGSVSIFGYDIKKFYQTCFSQQFYFTDFISFTLNQNLRPIPIQGDFQIDMNRIQRGQICNIKRVPYQNQFINNFDKFWKQNQRLNLTKPINHKNSLFSKKENENYSSYLNKIKFNNKQGQHFDSKYSKNLQQIQATKQALLYDQRQKQSKIFQKIIQDKVKKFKGQSSQQLPQLTHDLILQQIDAKGKRGGRRLMRAGQRKNYPNYKDDNFFYDSANQQSYKASQDAGQDQDNIQLDYKIDEDSDQFPRIRRNIRNINNGNQNQRQHYKILRDRNRTNYRDMVQYDEQQQLNTMKRKRISPAQDVQQMLKDSQYLNYDFNNNKGRKKVKRNRMKQDDSESFIDDLQSDDQYNQKRKNKYSNERNQQNRTTHGRRGRPRKYQIIQQENQDSQNQPQKYNSSQHKNKKQNSFQQQQKDQNQYDQTHNLRTRNRNSQIIKNGSSKKKHILGQCYRCAVNLSVVQCQICETPYCQTCKNKRGKQVQSDKYTCFICIYINLTTIPITDDKKISEQYFRFQERSKSIYVPQIDDQVRFFFQGYEQFLYHNVKYLNPKVTDQLPDYLLMPHIYGDQYEQYLLQTPLCKVKNIKFYFPYGNYNSLSNTYKRRNHSNEKKNHINMLINLQLVQTEQMKKKDLKRTDFWIFYIPGPKKIDSYNQYLLRQQIYKYVQENKVLQRLNQHSTVQIQGQEYQIISKNPLQDVFPTSIWKQIVITKSDGKRLRNMSKQSQKRCNVWNISSMVPEIQYNTDGKVQNNKRKLLESIQTIRNQQQDYQLFEDYIDFDIIDDYRKYIEVGVCLNTIQKRIKKNFYKSIKALEFDLDLMVNNSIIYNGQQNNVTKIGKNIRREILKAVNIYRNDDKQQLKITFSEQINNKKQIKKVSTNKKKDYDQIIEQQPVRTLRNKRTQKNKQISKRKKQQDYQFNQQQSQYNQQVQDDLSQESIKFGRKLRNNRKIDNNTNKQLQFNRLRKNDKISQDYDKQQEIYNRIKNRKRKQRYIDSSLDSHLSHQKNHNSNYTTRRSSRLNH